MMQDEPLPDARARLQPPRVQNTDTPAHLRGLGVTPSQIALLRQIEEKSEEDGEASFSSLVGPDPRSAAVLYSRLLSLESQFLVRFSWRENPRNEWDNRVQFIHLTEWGRDVLLSWLEEEYAESG